MNIFDFENVQEKKMAKESDNGSSAVKAVTSMIYFCVLAAFIPFFIHLLYVIGAWSWNLL